MKELKQEIKQQAIDNIEQYIDSEVYGCELHNELYNTNYYIIGTYKATEAMGKDVFECIGMVQRYENDAFGEVNTSLSDPEKVLSMVAYIVGEEFLYTSKTLKEEIDNVLTREAILLIKSELEENLNG